MSVMYPKYLMTITIRDYKVLKKYKKKMTGWYRIGITLNIHLCTLTLCKSTRKDLYTGYKEIIKKTSIVQRSRSIFFTSIQTGLFNE